MAKEFARQVLASQEEERRAIAADLHDDVLQQLRVVRLLAEQRGDEHSSGLLAGAIDSLRGTAHRLHPPGLRHDDLRVALEELVKRESLLAPPTVELSVELAGAVPADVAIVVYRVVQEGLTNARKHAGASLVRVKLSDAGGLLRLRVIDNGKGLARSGEGFGIRSMRERMESVGGELKLLTGPGGGVMLEAVIPTRRGSR